MLASSPATVWRVVAGARQHVVPLQDLVQDDPVDEAAEPDAEQQRATAREGSLRIRRRTGVASMTGAVTPPAAAGHPRMPGVTKLLQAPRVRYLGGAVPPAQYAGSLSPLTSRVLCRAETLPPCPISILLSHSMTRPRPPATSPVVAGSLLVATIVLCAGHRVRARRARRLACPAWASPACSPAFAAGFALVISRFRDSIDPRDILRIIDLVLLALALPRLPGRGPADPRLGHGRRHLGHVARHRLVSDRSAPRPPMIQVVGRSRPAR